MGTMPTVAGTHAYQYLRPSRVADGGHCALATSGGLTAPVRPPTPGSSAASWPRRSPPRPGCWRWPTSPGPAIYQPQAAAWRDPVVTCAGDRLRFESFSGCCGVYARLDVLPAGLDGEVSTAAPPTSTSTAPLREALARVGGSDPLHLSASAPTSWPCTTLDGAVVEKKVPLPDALAARLRRGPGHRGRRSTCAPSCPAADAYRVPALAAGRAATDRCCGRSRPAGRCGCRRRPVPGAVCLAGPARLARAACRCCASPRRCGCTGRPSAPARAGAERLGAGPARHAAVTDAVARAAARLLRRGRGARRARQRRGRPPTPS